MIVRNSRNRSYKPRRSPAMPIATPILHAKQPQYSTFIIHKYEKEKTRTSNSLSAQKKYLVSCFPLLFITFYYINFSWYEFVNDSKGTKCLFVCCCFAMLSMFGNSHCLEMRSSHSHKVTHLCRFCNHSRDTQHFYYWLWDNMNCCFCCSISLRNSS